MVNPKKKVFAYIGLTTIYSVVLFSCGIFWGFRHEEPKMGLCFFFAVFWIDVCFGLLLNLKIDTSFIRLENFVLGKSDSVPFRSSIDIMTIIRDCSSNTEYF